MRFLRETAVGDMRRPAEMGNAASKTNETRLEEMLVQTFREEAPPVGFLKEPVALTTFRTLNYYTPDYIDKVLLCIETDFYLALQCILQANSGEFRERARVENLRQAFVRLGFTKVQSFAMNYDLSLDPSGENRIGLLWFKSLRQHSVSIAIASYFHAMTFRGKNPENCFLVGLFHEIGAVYLSRLFMSEFAGEPNIRNLYGVPVRSADTQKLQEAGKKFHSMILNKMRFPGFAIETLSFEEPDRSEENCFRNALQSSHIIEACFGDLLFPHLPAETSSDEEEEESEPEKWTRATETAAKQIRETIPSLDLGPEQVDEMATRIKTRMDRTAAFVEFG